MIAQTSAIRDLKQAAEEYLSWMSTKQYASSTLIVYKLVLRKFILFLQPMNPTWEEIFANGTIVGFEAQLPKRYTAAAVWGLARRLYAQGKIAGPIQKSFISLPGIYETYLYTYQNVHQITPGYLRSMRYILHQFHIFLEQQKLSLTDLNIEHIDNFLSRFKGYAPVTRRHYRAAVRSFTAYLYENKIICRNLSCWIKGAPDFGYANPPRFLRPHEIQKIFDVITEPSSANLRAYAMIHLAYLLGLRPVEISRIKLDDIHFASLQITIPDRKSRNPICLPVSEVAIKAIAAYVIGARPKSEFRELFLNRHAPYAPVTAATVCKDITGYMRKAGLDCSAYFLRHTYAQNLLETGHCIFEVKQMLGHDSIQTTKRYLHIHPTLMRKVLFDESL